jgi:L-seryl-tRNA(Ser) seleniumtransferase
MTSLRELPSVDRVAKSLPGDLPGALATEIARAAVDEARGILRSGGSADPLEMAATAAESLVRTRPRPVINATGVLLHTNLGRAPLDPAAAAAAKDASERYGNLEMDLGSGRRGGRGAYALRVLTTITGAESAMVVNNNAGALFLSLLALAAGRSVPVSRGELIEIGGSYRLPDLMAASGARLVEIGTTNRTRIADYEAACDDTTAMILKVHPSNYRIEGFAQSAGLEELVALAGSRRLPMIYDVGSGLIDERTPWLPGAPPSWLKGEPGVRQSIESGAGLVMFSGDKLMGGPQAGVVVGQGSLVARLRNHPVARAMRIDGPSLAALAVTLERYADGTAASLPFWKMATAPYGELEVRARQVVAEADIDAEVLSGTSTVGAGSVPGSEVISPVIAIPGATESRYLALLASAPFPVVGRREEGRLIIDLRSVEPADDTRVAAALRSVCRS